MTPLTPDEVLQYGRNTQQLQQNPTFQKLIEDFNADIHAKWANATDEKVRNELWHQLHGLEGFLQSMQTVIERGEELLAEAEQAERRAKPSTLTRDQRRLETLA